MKSFFDDAKKFIRKHALLLSVLISFLAFLVPIQITNESTIFGIDMILYFKTNGWWSIGAPIAFVIALVCLVFTIYYMVLAIKIARSEKKGKRVDKTKKEKVLIFGFIFACFYFLFGIVINLICWSGYNPHTFAFIPFLLQIPIYLVYREDRTERMVHKFLSEIGVKETDTVVVHSSMKALGKVKGGCDGLIDAFCSYLTEGLLIIPTHTWANVGSANPVFDVRNTVPCIGALPTVAAFRKDGVRSLHPTHSVAVFGKRAKEFVAGEEKCTSPCTPGGVWARLYDENAKILLVGVSLNSNTFIHAVDELYDIKQRFGKEVKIGKFIEITIIDSDGNSQVINCRRHGWTGSREFDRYTKAFEETGILTYSKLGKATVGIMNAKESAEIMAEIFRREEFL